MLDAVGEAVIATDLGGTVVYWNGAAERLYGYSSDEAVGRSIGDLTVPDASHEQGEQIMAAVTAGRSWTGEFPVQNRTGRVFPARVTDAPFVDGTGALVGVIGVSRDLTDEVRPAPRYRRARNCSGASSPRVPSPRSWWARTSACAG
jgi:PAS domain S-box-containing protein